MGVELHPSHFRHEGISFIENKRSEIGVQSAHKILTLCVTAILVLTAKVVSISSVAYCQWFKNQQKIA